MGVNKESLLKKRNKQKKVNMEIAPSEIKPKVPCRCTCCGKERSNGSGYFTKSNSPLYANNGGYINICNECRDLYFEKLLTLYGDDEEKSIRRICQLFDLYFDKAPLFIAKKTGVGVSTLRSYLAKCNLTQYSKPKSTYVDTIKNELRQGKKVVEDVKSGNSDAIVRADTIERFGEGLEYPDDYILLQTEYDDWTSRHECTTKVQEELFKNLCFSQLNIKKAQINGDKKETALKAFQDLLGSANLKPKQMVDQQKSASIEETLGTLIDRLEVDTPVPDPQDNWKDVDGIVRHIETFFKGHMAKMLGLKNSYSQIYEDEMKKYTVNKPEYEEDDQALFDTIFGDNEEDE